MLPEPIANGADGGFVQRAGERGNAYHRALNVTNALGPWFAGIPIAMGFGFATAGCIDAARCPSAISSCGCILGDVPFAELWKFRNRTDLI